MNSTTRRNNRTLDTTGRKFGRLTVLREEKAAGTDAVRTFCVCLCDCGREYRAPKHAVVAGARTACGCVLAGRRHGMSNKNKRPGEAPRVYTVWKGIRARCLCETATGYANYGGRGIAIDPRWEDFAAFRADVMALLPAGATDIPRHLDVDRIDNDGPYAPGNVQLSTRSQNLSHRRGNVLVEIGGETRTLTEWCRAYGVTASCVRHRVKALGWDVVAAITTPKADKAYGPDMTANLSRAKAKADAARAGGEAGTEAA